MENCLNHITNDELTKFNLYLYLYIIPQSLCPPKGQGFKLRWNIKGVSELYFKVLLCNKTKNPNCYSEEEIEEKYENGELDNTQLDFIQEYSTIDNYNHSDL